ncbi:hypothetical protein NFJ02_22g50230 [Pycnococcus provasolii]
MALRSYRGFSSSLLSPWWRRSNFISRFNGAERSSSSDVARERHSSPREFISSHRHDGLRARISSLHLRTSGASFLVHVLTVRPPCRWLR